MTDPPQPSPSNTPRAPTAPGTAHMVSPLQAIHPWDDSRVEVPGTNTTIAALRAGLRTSTPPPATRAMVRMLHRVARGLLALLDDGHDQAEQALWRHDPVTLFQSWTRTLGPTLTGFVMGATAEDVEAWADADSDVGFPIPEDLEGVAFAQRVWAEMAHHLADDDEARLWFLASNPWLPDDLTPLQAIRERDYAAVAHAVAQHHHDESLRRPSIADRHRRPAQPIQTWGVWDAGELYSLHTTQRDARDAAEVHLHQVLDDFPGDERLVCNAIQVHPLRLHIDGNRHRPPATSTSPASSVS